MVLFIYQTKPNHFRAKTYVNMSLVNINLKEMLRKEPRMVIGLGGKRMVLKS